MTARGVAHARRDDDHQPDDGRVPRGRAQPPRGAGADGLLMRGRRSRRAAARRLRRGRGRRGQCHGQPDRAAVDPRAGAGRPIRKLTARLQPLDPGDVTHEGLGGPGCASAAAANLLLAASADDAIARIGGRLLHFAHSAPVGPSGGFFEDRQSSISVGRTDAAAGPAQAAAGWPARITVTNRRTGAQVELAGIWRCGA